MGLYKASSTTTLTVVPNIGTFTAYLLCDKGDLWQDYTGDDPVTSPGTIYPDFTTNPRKLTLYVSSSRVTGQEIPDRVEFKLGAVSLGYIEKTSTGYNEFPNSSYVDVFELLNPNENDGSYGLKIKKNLVSVTNGESGQIYALYKVSEGTSSADLQVSCPFRISQVTENSTRVVIEPGDNNNFIISKAAQSVILEAHYYVGADDRSTGKYFVWCKQSYGNNLSGAGDVPSHWIVLTGQNSSTLTVQEGDVHSSQMYMVLVYDEAGGTLLGQDVQLVVDGQDPYEVVFSRDPADGQAHKAGDVVDVSCEVFRRGSSATVLPSGTFSWAFLGVSPGGTTILQKTSSTRIGSCAVTYDDIMAAGGQLELTATVEFG